MNIYLKMNNYQIAQYLFKDLINKKKSGMLISKFKWRIIYIKTISIIFLIIINLANNNFTI